MEPEPEQIYPRPLNDKQKIATQLINSGRNACIVGPGGTGKSRLVDYIEWINHEYIGLPQESLLLLAPTGMAAYNMNEYKGKTIHSLFGIGEKSLYIHNWNKVKIYINRNINLIKNRLDLVKVIIMDEVSMVLSGTIDTLVQTFTLIYGPRPNDPFHGRQLITLLDPLQLPPCPPSDHINHALNPKLMLTDYPYNNIHFVNLFNRELGNIIHLTENMRCNDPEWVKLLYHSRIGFKNTTDIEIEDCMRILNTRRIIEDRIKQGGDLYELCNNSLKVAYRNKVVQKINDDELSKLLDNNSNTYKDYPINIKFSIDEFRSKFSHQINNPDSLYNNLITSMHKLNGYKVSLNEDNTYDTTFRSVIGERVMLRTNSYDNLKTGALGNIISYDNNRITVEFDNGITENISYITFIHPDYSDIKIDAIPLIPAWAITIHKLQGQTIEYPYFVLFESCNRWPCSVFYTALSRTTRQNNVYIVNDFTICRGEFEIDEECWKWYSNNCLCPPDAP